MPRGLHDYLVQLAKRDHADEVPFGTVREGAVLFADASGFTRLTEQLAQEVRQHPPTRYGTPPSRPSRLLTRQACASLPSQQSGAERLCTIINDFFTKVVAIVHAYGGDIVKVCA